MLDGSNRQTVVTDDQQSTAHYICAGAVRSLVGKGELLQKSIEGFSSAIELVQLMCSVEGFDG